MHLLVLYWFNTGMLLFLAKKGLPLRCEICSSTDFDCIGPLRSCLPILDTCTIVESERLPGPDMKDPYPHIRKHAMMKRCTQASICNENITIVNVGRGGTIVTKQYCCREERCRGPLLPLPPINTTFNGKQCPVCFSFWSNECRPEGMVDCAGDQNYCLVVSGIGNAGSPGTFEYFGQKVVTSYLAIQGCANKAFCDTFHEGVVHLATLTIAGEERPKAQKISPVMNLLILVWLHTGMLLFLANKGESLMCEICSSTGYNCTGSAQTCLSGLDKCAVLQSKSIMFSPPLPDREVTQSPFYKETYISSKVCIQSNQCDEDLTVVNMGKGGVVSSKLSCCTGSLCNIPVLPLPPINTTFNGKKCKACFALHKTKCSKEEIIHCAGEQMYCVDISGVGTFRSFGTIQTLNLEVPRTEVAFKGCANKAFCDAFYESSVQVSTLVVIGDGYCKLASEARGAISSFFGLILLPGLLLVNILA